MESERRAVKWGEVAALAVLTAVLGVSLVWRPPDDGGFILCAFRRLTGVPCAACGLTRSVCAMAKGESARAASFHPLGPGLFLIACAYWLRGVAAVSGFAAYVARFDRTVRRWRLPETLLAVLLVVWIAGLVSAGLDGRLAELARHGILARLFG